MRDLTGEPGVIPVLEVDPTDKPHWFVTEEATLLADQPYPHLARSDEVAQLVGGPDRGLDLGPDHEDVGSSNISADQSRTDGGGASFWAK